MNSKTSRGDAFAVLSIVMGSRLPSGKKQDGLTEGKHIRNIDLVGNTRRVAAERR